MILFSKYFATVEGFEGKGISIGQNGLIYFSKEDGANLPFLTVFKKKQNSKHK